jgi:hypothetical protein
LRVAEGWWCLLVRTRLGSGLSLARGALVALPRRAARRMWEKLATILDILKDLFM